MPSLSRETLRGYVLEELVARLIRSTGYSLLVDESQDRAQLVNRHNGLVLRGRGGEHQVDVLGELAWIPAFTFPIRLVVEAKARKGKVGINEVRNAVGVLLDVNQFSPTGARPDVKPQKRYSYQHALFSTSGFTAPAAEYALAHQISLVDLSSQDFSDVVQLADDIADAIWRNGESPSRRVGFIARLRTELRVQLGTWPEHVPPGVTQEDDRELRQPIAATGIRERVARIGELFVGMANGPYLLVLRAFNHDAVLDALELEPVRRVSVHWDPQQEGGTRWTVMINGNPALSLNFTLPDPVARWIFGADADPEALAMEFKREFLRSITIYRHIDGQDRLYRLQFSRRETAEAVDRLNR